MMNEPDVRLVAAVFVTFYLIPMLGLLRVLADAETFPDRDIERVMGLAGVSASFALLASFLAYRNIVFAALSACVAVAFYVKAAHSVWSQIIDRETTTV